MSYLEFDPLLSNVLALPDPPAPPAVAYADEDAPADYIPEGMTAEARQQLRESAQMVSGLMASPVTRMARPTHARASLHMEHFLTGEGRDIELSPEEADDLATSSQDSYYFENSLLDNFLSAINDDFQARDISAQQYISRNNNEASANRGTPWFGLPSAASANTGTNWYYAIGAFWMCYTVLARRLVGYGIVEITYRRHVFDRYNWHNDLNIELPAFLMNGLPSESMDMLLGTATAGAEPAPFIAPVVTEEGQVAPAIPQVLVDDSFFGSLIDDDEAHPYNVVGSGQIYVAEFPLKAAQ